MDQQQLFVKMALTTWDLYLKRADKLFSSLTDQQLLKEIAPGRNRGFYLLGHLTAVHDNMFPLFGLGQRLYPQLDQTFLNSPDKVATDIHSVGELREHWAKVNAELEKGFAGMSAADWFAKHASVSEEDFAKEPHRNKLSVLLNRTNHLAYHFGQVALTK